MDYNQLLEGICEMGYRLLGCGAEIPRVEDTIRRLAAAYGTHAEVFAIPNCLIVSITDADGKQITRMRQVRSGSIDILALEDYNALSRRLCANPPADTGEISIQVKAVAEKIKPYPTLIHLLGCFVGAAFFALFYSGSLWDAIIAGIAGVAAGGCALLLSRTRSNFFINTAAAGFVLTAVAYGLYLLGAPVNLGTVIVGATMVLVPGLIFTNFMSDLLTGDIVAGLTTFARAVLTAGAIALGTGIAASLCQRIANIPTSVTPLFLMSPLPACTFAFIACVGFCLTFNVRGVSGTILCCLGGALGWAVYLLCSNAGSSVYVSTLAASLVISVYSECMARLRKCPTTAYLVVSYFPLVPGFTIYQAMSHGIQGDIDLFISTFIRTFGIAGCIALGTLIVSTAVRIIHTKREHKS